MTNKGIIVIITILVFFSCSQTTQKKETKSQIKSYPDYQNYPFNSLVPKQNNFFNLNIFLFIHYKELSEGISEKLSNKPLVFKGISTTFGRILILSDGSSLYIKTKFNIKDIPFLGKIDGKLYFEATPKLENSKLELTNIDFYVDTKKLPKWVKNWLRERVIKEVKKYFTIDIKKENQKVKEYINKKIADVNIGKFLKLNGNVRTISINDMNLTRNGIYVDINIMGDAKSKKDSLSPLLE